MGDPLLLVGGGGGAGGESPGGGGGDSSMVVGHNSAYVTEHKFALQPQLRVSAINTTAVLLRDPAQKC